MPHKKILVIGLGRFGSALVAELWDTNADIVVVDRDPEAVDAHKSRVSAAFVADATVPGVLEQLGAHEMDVAVVTSGEDFEASVLCVSQLSQMGVKTIFARAANDRQAHVLRAVGATRAVQIEKEMGSRMAVQVLNPVATELLDFAMDFRVVPWVVPASHVGRGLEQVNFRSYGINVLGYLRPEPGSKAKPRIHLPNTDYQLSAGDTLLLVGEEQELERFLEAVE